MEGGYVDRVFEYWQITKHYYNAKLIRDKTVHVDENIEHRNTMHLNLGLFILVISKRVLIKFSLLFIVLKMISKLHSYSFTSQAKKENTARK